MEKLLKHPVMVLGEQLRKTWALLALLAGLIAYGASLLDTPQIVVRYAIIPLAREGLLHTSTRPHEQDVFLIDIANNTLEVIDHVEIHILGARTIDRMTIVSNRTGVLRDVSPTIEDRATGLVVVPSVTSLAPGTDARILAWGQFSEQFFGPEMRVLSDAKSTRVQQLHLVTGWWLALYRNEDVLYLLMLSALVVLIVRRVTWRRS